MGCKILIVDDSATTRALIRRAIQLAGIPADAIHEAANGLMALKVLDEHDVDLVLADLHMPEMSGVDLAMRIFATERLSHLAVVTISAEPDESRLERLRELGVRATLRKPFTPEALRDVVQSVLGEVHA